MSNGEREVSGAEARRSRLRFDRFCQSPSPPCKAIPTNNASGAAVRGRSEHGEGLPEDGLYLRVSGPEGRLRACTRQLTAAPPTAMKKNSYNTHH